MIMKFIVALIIGSIISGVIIALYVERKKEREKKVFANQPLDMLKYFMLMDIECALFYRGMRNVMSDEMATKRAVNHYLIKNGLLGYREDDEDEG